MEKCIIKETGKEIKVGDVLTVTSNTPFGKISSDILVTEEVLNKLQKHNLVYKESDKSLDITSLITHLAKRIGWKNENVVKYLNSLDIMCPKAVFNVFLLEIAFVLDEQYEDHISKSDKFYILAHSKEGQMIVAEFPTFIKDVPMFRNEEDATRALEFMQKVFPEICYNGK